MQGMSPYWRENYKHHTNSLHISLSWILLVLALPHGRALAGKDGGEETWKANMHRRSTAAADVLPATAQRVAWRCWRESSKICCFFGPLKVVFTVEEKLV